MTLVDQAASPCESTVAGRDVGRTPVAVLPVGHAWRAGGLDEAHVLALASAMGQVPPILVRRSDLLVVDGAHRVAAARRLGLRELPVEWFDGSRTDAFVEFVARQARSGLPLTTEDRERGVARLLGAEPRWSDRRIAHLCGVSPKLVARLRPGHLCDPDGVGDKRVGRDGRARPVRPGVMRLRIVEAIEREPGASLRAIAAQLGVSPETVRSVRKEVGVREERPVELATSCAACARRAVEEVLAQSHHVRFAPWLTDNAMQSTEQGVSFVEWFEAAAVEDGRGREDEVPISRVYEIADEARRRASFWSGFADSLEGRTRRR
jgi:transposase-like protein